MAFNRKHDLKNAKPQEDEIYGIFMGYNNLDPLVEKICNHFAEQPLETTLQKSHSICSYNALIGFQNSQSFLFAIWLCPELELGKEAQPRRFEPFQAGIQNICMDILKGKFLSVQEFVTNAVTDYHSYSKKLKHFTFSWLMFLFFFFLRPLRLAHTFRPPRRHCFRTRSPPVRLRCFRARRHFRTHLQTRSDSSYSLAELSSTLKSSSNSCS